MKLEVQDTYDHMETYLGNKALARSLSLTRCPLALHALAHIIVR